MRDAFYDALDKWHGKNKGGFGGAIGGGGGGGGGGAQAAASGTTILGKAASEAGGLIKGLAGGALDLSTKMAKGGLSVTEATKTIGDSLKNAGGAGATLATSLGKTVDAFGDIINYVEEGVDVFRELSQTGATFNNSVVDMRAAAAGSRLTMQEFGNIIKNNNTSFLALGESGEQGAKAFARLSKGFFDSGFGDKLTQLGYTSEDLNKLMAIQMTNMSARELREKGGEAAQFAATAKLAEEMDLMAKLTGKSRKEQEETLAKAKASGQVQAAVQLEQMNGNAKAGEAFDAVATSTSGKFGELVQQMVSAGRPLTDEGRKYMGMLSQETQAAIQEARDAYKRGDVEGAREAAKRAQALESAEAATNKSRLALAAQGVKGFEEATQEGIRYGKALAEKARELGTSITDPKAIEAARKSLEDQAKKEQAARSGETASVIEAQNRIKDMGSAIQESIIVPLKDEANKRALNDFYKTLADLNQSKAKGGTAGSDKGFAGDVSKAVQPAVEGIKSAIARLVDEKGPEQKFSSEAARAVNQSQADALKKAVSESSRKDVTAAEGNEIKALAKSLKTVDGEAVSKKLEEIAKAQGKSSSDVLKEAINKPGGIGNLTKQIGEDPAAKQQLALSAEAVKKEQAAKAAAEIAKSKGRDTTGTAGEAIKQGAGAIGSALGSLTTGTIELFKVQGDVKIDTAKLPGAADGGVLKGPESGYLAMLHGEETVIPNKDIDAVISGAISKLPVPKAPGEEKSFAESMAADVRKGMQTVGVNPDMRGGGASGLDLSTISKDISTTISSSVTGGGSSSVSRKQSRESKNAEDELQVVKDKYVDERSALAAKFAETMPESSARDRRKAMNESDEGKALNAKYEALMKPLEKKIEDGIKWEMGEKLGAVEETKKVLSEELLMLKAQGLEKLAITEFNEEEIAKMLEKSGEDLNNFYIDMNGDLKSWADETASVFGQGMSDAEAMMAEQTTSTDKPVVGGMNFESMFTPVRTSAQSMMEKFGKETEQKKADEAKAAADKAAAKPGNAEKKPDSKPAPAASKADSTLNDVVNSLDRLNMMMGQLLSQSEDLGKKQLRASKANSVQP